MYKYRYRRIIDTIISGAVITGLLSGCGSAYGQKASENASAAKTVTTGESTTAENTQSTAAAESTAEATGKKDVIVYFANWNLGESDHGEVASIPWDSVTSINHAFWAVAPSDGSKETSFQRRDAGEKPRTDFGIISTAEKNDIEDKTPSAVDTSLKERNNFAEYEAYSKKYPDVKIMLSIGGWSDCGYFSEMAYTKEGRASFIKSCEDLMDKYTWIDGIDLDWEYPGGSQDGERKSEDEGDQGCCIWGTQPEDAANFVSLCKEMKESFAGKYGNGVKSLTACASASTSYTLPYNDWRNASKYLDKINIMTYDMAGSWDGVTGHGSSISGTKDAIVYFLQNDVPTAELNIGTPLYSTGFKMTDTSNGIVGAKVDENFTFDGDSCTQEKLMELEKKSVSGFKTKTDASGKVVMGSEYGSKDDPGWHFAFDDAAGATYLYNNDKSSDEYNEFISYESPLSLQAKLDLINRYKLGGIIVWECSQDADNFPMIHQMHSALNGK